MFFLNFKLFRFPFHKSFLIILIARLENLFGIIKLQGLNLRHYIWPLKKGRLQLPDFMLYFWVAQMIAVWFWQMNSTAPPAWIQIEKYHEGEIPLDKALFIPLSYVIREVNNPFIRHTCKLGFEIKKKYKWLLPL